MKFFILSIDGILTIFTCFTLISSNLDIPSVSWALSNSTTEFSCNEENGCNTTESVTVNSELPTSSNISDDKPVTSSVFITTQTTLCPVNGCQTNSSSPEIEISPTNSTSSDEVTSNVTLTTSFEMNNASETISKLKEPTAVVNITNSTDISELTDFNTSTEFETTTKETNTESLKNETQIDHTSYPEINNSSLYNQTDSTYTENINNSLSTVINEYNSSEIFSNIDSTTDTSTETTAESSNYTEKSDGSELQTLNITFSEDFTENITKMNFSLTDTLSNDTKTTVYNISVTDSTLFIDNSTTDMTTNRPLETSVIYSTEYLNNQTDSTENITDKPNSTFEDSTTTIILDNSTESITNYTTVFVINELPTVTPYRNYLTVEVKINCSENKKQMEISLLLAEFLNTTLKDSKDCTVLRNITIIVPNEMVEFSKISQFLTEKFNTVQLVKIWPNFRDVNMTDTVTVADEVTEREVILYVSLGVCLGIVLLLAVAITCFKCLRKRSNKPLDLDVPHLNLRLEDYTLTRIPRPNTVYLDYYRGPIINDRYSSAPLTNSVGSNNPERGLIQPFDTSVIPLEDAKKLEDLTTPITLNETTCPSTPLRTFGRKDWKNGDGLIYENIMSSSTEKLHSDFFKSGHRGEDNPTFAA